LIPGQWKRIGSRWSWVNEKAFLDKFDTREIMRMMTLLNFSGKARWGLRWKISFAAFSVFFLCLGWFPVFAQNITLEADVSARRVALDDYIRLTLTATGIQTLEPVDLPDIQGFDSRFIGPASRVSIINGQRSSSYALLYDLYPQRTGTFTIPSLTLTIQGRVYQTDPMQIEVVSPSAPQQAQQPGQGQSPPVESLEDKIFLMIASPYTDVYLNQKIPVIARIYVSGLSVRDVEYPQIEHAGFLVDAFENPRQFEDVLDGVRYSVVEFRTAVYPLRTGELLLGPARGGCSILTRNTSRTDRSGMPSFFDADVFSGFFDTYTSRPVILESRPLTFNVRPLPEDGRPEGFSGAVGKFSFDMTVSPLKVRVGDPVTVRMTVSGTGSLRTVEMPAFESDNDFRVYAPVIREENGVKVLEQVLIPQREDITDVPAVKFTFFDVDEKRYRTVVHGPTSLEVDPVERGTEFRVMGPGADGVVTRRDDVGRDIAFIKSKPGDLRFRGHGVFASMRFLAGLLVILALWIGGILFYQFTLRLKTDEKFARRLQAPAYARRGLKNMKACLDREDKEGFYNEAFKAMERYFAHKFHLAPGAVTLSVICQELDRKGGGNNGIGIKIRAVFEECEAARYAAAGFSREQMARTYQHAREIIDWFERKF
jgi:hypothetical protein